MTVDESICNSRTSVEVVNGKNLGSDFNCDYRMMGGIWKNAQEGEVRSQKTEVT
jgi:hypothetical protein